MRLRRAIAAAIVISTLVGAPTANGQFKPSKNEQIRLGREAASQVRKKEKVLVRTEERVVVLQRVADRLMATFDRSKEPWEYSFDVIDNKQLNAFAFPGGPVFFYTGLLDKIRTEDQLAGVLSHELTHVRKEHWARQYEDSQKRNILLTIGLILTRSNRTIGDLVGVANSLVSLKYSRRSETESDDNGLDMMVKAGYNPEGMADVFRILSQQGGGKPPEFLSTHPADSARIRRIEDRAAKMPLTGEPQKLLPWAR